MRMHRFLLLSVLLLCGPLQAAGSAEAPVRIFAAASLTDALNEVAAQWRRAGHPQPSLAFGASSTLAKQVEAGAPADVFASADLKWMDYLDQRSRIDHTTRANLLGNTLVLIAPRGKGFKARMEPGFAIADAFAGKLCTGEPGVVPVGIYAKESLEKLGWWSSLQGRIVGTDDVRTALAFVERGECGAVVTVAAFPAQTHAPIVYPFAAVKNARPETLAFLRFLHTSQAAAIFRRHGFTVLKP
jgi:molybdate transport system substrate-binding protein